MREAMFSSERMNLIGALIPLLDETAAWNQRYEIEWYVSKCQDEGFAQTSDQIRLCAERFIAGKRKVTPPGTARRKRAEKKMREVLANTPKELREAIDAVISEQVKAVEQYRSGIDKAINSLVGAVMKRHKSDPAIIRELLSRKIRQ